MPRRPAAFWMSAAAVIVAGCTGRYPEEPPRDPFPKTYNEIEHRRVDLAPIHERQRRAMDEADGAGSPDGGLSQVISLDQREYFPDDPVFLTMLWVNNTARPMRVSRRLFLDLNFRPLIFLDDKVQVLYNVSRLPPPPTAPLREKDFWVIPPYGEKSLVVDLTDLPRYGEDVGAKVRWGYDVSRPGRYAIRVGARSVPAQLVPESLRGDPTASHWEGSTLSNVARFRIRKRR